ncbi:MAG TPA: carbohydrate porin [Kofleriaceae bacterium]|nr:carbohydrate porin [Kofleriaceae bacterium]
MRSALVVVMLASRAAIADPDARADDTYDVMNLLARHGDHDLDDERWNAYGQVTWIEQAKLPFHAAYTNFGQPQGGQGNSLLPGYENSFSGTATIYAGAKLWPDAELYVAPELISELPLSRLTGLGGAITNFEMQKGGSPSPAAYLSRLYLQQTIPLGGGHDVIASGPLSLAKKQLDRRRIVLTAGRFSLLDFFDKSTYAGDGRRQQINMAFVTYAAYDFTADTRGYTWGGIAELYFDDWQLRYARTAPPKLPNRSNLDFSFGLFDAATSPGGVEAHGDQVELVHQHALDGHPGAVHVLAYSNYEYMGRFDDALVLFGGDPTTYSAAGCPDPMTSFANSISKAFAPDMCLVRKGNTKQGIGISAEQEVARDIGVFARAMYADGETEVEAFTPTDRSVAVGALARGGRWCRRNDYAGIGLGAGWISDEHAKYLELGGIDGFVGDGKLTPGTETIAELFYGANIASSIYLSGDYQFIVNPAFNSDRGPVHVFGARLHAEF